MSVEKLATRAQITENLEQISKELNSIITTQPLTYKSIKSQIKNILDAYNNLNNLVKNNQRSDIDIILNKLRKLLVVLTKEINGIIMYSYDQKTYISNQSSEILNDIDNILRQFSNDDATRPTKQRQSDDVRKELAQLRAAKPDGNTIEELEKYTYDVGKAVIPTKDVAKRPEPTTANLPPPPAIPNTKQREQLFPPRPTAAPVVNRPATAETIAQTDKSPKPLRGFMSPTFASQMRENEEKKVAKEAATHMAAAAHNRETFKNTVHIGEKGTNKPRSGGQSTKKKSRKPSHNKRHTKRAMPGKPQTKTRNKRTKRGRNKTHKK